MLNHHGLVVYLLIEQIVHDLIFVISYQTHFRIKQHFDFLSKRNFKQAQKFIYMPAQTVNVQSSAMTVKLDDASAPRVGTASQVITLVKKFGKSNKKRTNELKKG